MTYTSTTATTSTTTRVIKQFPSPLLSSGGILGALELAFSDPLEVLISTFPKFPIHFEYL